MKLDTLVNLFIDGSIDKETYNEKKSSLERDRNNLKVFLNDIDGRIGAWMKKVEEAIDFATDARKEFETGNMEKRRLILSTIGENLRLKDRKLIIKAEKPLSIIQEAAFEARVISNRLEPPKNKALQRRILESYSKNPILCPGEDSNLQALAGATTSRWYVYQFRHLGRCERNYTTQRPLRRLARLRALQARRCSHRSRHSSCARPRAGDGPPWPPSRG